MQNREIERSLEQGAQALSLAVDREFSGYVRFLQGFAHSHLLATGDLAGFHALTRRAVEKGDALSLALFDATGRQVLHSSHAYGAQLPQPVLQPSAEVDSEGALPGRDLSAIRRALAGTPGNTNLFHSASMKRALFTVAVPILREGKPVYALVGGFSPDNLAGLLKSQFGTTTATVTDGNNIIVARATDGLRFTGQPSKILRAFPRDQAAGAGTAVNRDGVRLAYAFKRSSVTGWVAAVGLDGEARSDAIRNAFLAAGLIVSIAVLAAVAAAGMLARRIRRSVLHLMAVAEGAPPGGSAITEVAAVEGALSELVQVRASQASEREQRLIAEVKEQETAKESRRKDLYLATLAHELRNPLAPIRNAVALLHLKGPPDPELIYARDVIDRQAAQMARLLDDLLDVSRIARGKIELRRARIDAADAVRDALETSRPALEGARQEITVVLPDQPVWVDADRVRLAQVFANLLTNAAKYTDPGGHIRVRLDAQDGQARISVADDGIGIEPELLASIFEPFTQSTKATQRAQGGLGIGLAIVKGLVELHGGRVQAKSEGPGRGAQFIVWLPLARAAARPAPPAAKASAPAKVARRVLVVDDNRDAADTLAMLLRSMGAQVEVAYDGTTALELAQRNPPSVALLDIGMPGMTGYELARRLSTLAEKPYLIALTGWGQEADRAAAADAGFDRHLTKPVDPKALVALLTRL